MNRKVVTLNGYNIFVHGNSFIDPTLVAANQPNGNPGIWPLQFQTGITADTLNSVIASAGHAAFAITGPWASPSFQLIPTIATDVDPAWVAGKHNVLVLHEVINQIYYGSTGAQAYAAVQLYFASTAKVWDVRIVVNPTPRNNTGTLVAGINSSGTAPPAVTIGATPAVGTFIRWTIDGAGGARGTATFTWTLNGVVQATGVLTAATVTLAGTVFNLPVGTYNPDNVFTATAGYEAERQAFITLALADPTFGGTVTDVYTVNNDARIGAPGSYNDSYYYAADLVHGKFTWHAICQAAIFDILRARFPANFPYSPAQMPYMSTGCDTSIAGSCLKAGGSVCANGDKIDTIVHAPGAYEGSNYVQTTDANRFTYNTASINAHPSATVGHTVTMKSQSTVNLGRSTMIAVIKATAVGNLLLHQDVAANTKHIRLYVESQFGGTTLTTWVEDITGATLNIKSSPAGCMNGAGVVVPVYSQDGTDAGQLFWVSGVSKALTTVSGLNGATGSVYGAAFVDINGNSGEGGFAGQFGAHYMTPVPLSTHERNQLETYLIARWS